MKNKIRESVVTWDSYEVDGNLEDVILKLQTLIKNKPDYFDFTISVDTVNEYYGSSSTRVNIYAFRWETDEELKERIITVKKRSEAAKLAAKQRLESQEKREKSLYESLKRKFEKEIDETNKS